MFKRVCLLYICIIVLWCVQNATAQDVAVINSPEVGPVVWFPIYPAKQKAIAIKIPDDFKQLKTKPGIYEFVPKADVDYFGWSQIVTITPYLRSGATSEGVVSSFIELMSRSSTDFELISMEHDEKGQIAATKAVMSYVHRGREEMLEIMAYSGPQDCVLVQNAVPISEDVDEKRVIAKLEQFFSQNVKILKVNDKH